MSDTQSPSKPTETMEPQDDGPDMRQIESPEVFYREFTQRPDVREILRRLATWRPPDKASNDRDG